MVKQSKLQSFISSAGSSGLLLSLTFSAFLSGCSGTVLSTSGAYLGVGTESVTEIVASTIVGSVNATDSNASTIAQRSFAPLRAAAVAAIFSRLLGAAQAVATQPTCQIAPFGSASTGTVSGSVINLTYSNSTQNNCNPPGGPTTTFWDGAEIYSFQSASDTAAYQASGGLTNGHSVSISYSGGVGPYSLNVLLFSPTAGPTATAVATYRAAGTVVYLDSTPADLTCYSANGGGGCNLTGTAGGLQITMGSGTRSLSIPGLRVVGAVNAATTVASWDLLVNTTSPFTVNGQGASKTMPAGGSMTVYVNTSSNYPTMANHVLTTTISKTLTWTAVSCHPSSGTITTTCPGSTTSFETLTYLTSSTATLTTCAGASSTITLQHCL